MDEILSLWRSSAVSFEDYNLESEFKSPGYSRSFFAQNTRTGQRVIARQLSPLWLGNRFLPVYKREISASLACHSPFVLPFVGFTPTFPYFLIHEAAGPISLASLIREGHMTGAQKTAVALTVALAMRDLHEANVVHGDLSAESVLFTEDGRLQLSLSRCSHTASNDQGNVPDGATSYWAPERFANGLSSYETDVYSYGVLVWELMCWRRACENFCSVQRQGKGAALSLPFASESPVRARMGECFSAAERRPKFSAIAERFSENKKEFLFPDRDDADGPDDPDDPVLKSYIVAAMGGESKPIPQFSDSLGPTKVIRELQGCLGMQQVQWIEAQAEDQGSAIELMTVCANLAEKCEDQNLCRNALFALRHLWARGPQFLDTFVTMKLHEKLAVKRQEIAQEILWVLLPLFAEHPETARPALIAQIVSCIGAYPKKVLALFAVICRSFSDDAISWDVIDALFLNEDLFVSAGLGRQFGGLLYSLQSRNPVFSAERSRSCIAFFGRCLRSGETALVELGYRTLTALRAPAPIDHRLLVDHFANPDLHRAVLRCLTVAPLDDLPPVIVEGVMDAGEKRLAIAVLWRLASFPQMIAPILSNGKKITRFKRTEVFTLLLVMATHPQNRQAVQECPFLPTLLKTLSDTDDVPLLSIISKLIRRLPVDATFLAKLERSRFLHVYLTHALAQSAAYGSAYLLIDTLLRIRCSLSFMEVLPVIFGHLNEDIQLKGYTLQLLVLFSAYPRARPKLTDLGVLGKVQSMPWNPREQRLVKMLADNMQESPASKRKVKH
jgi:serine/threonine protein kinase